MALHTIKLLQYYTVKNDCKFNKSLFISVAYQSYLLCISSFLLTILVYFSGGWAMIRLYSNLGMKIVTVEKYI